MQLFTYFGVDATVEEEVRPGIMLTKAVRSRRWVCGPGERPSALAWCMKLGPPRHGVWHAGIQALTHPGPRLHAPSQGPLAGWVDKVASALREVGQAAQTAGQPSLGAWVLGQLPPAATASEAGSSEATPAPDGQSPGTAPPSDERSASALVEWLVAAVPGFEDEPVLASGSDVRFARKAQSLAAALGLPGSEAMCLDSGPGNLLALRGGGVIKVQGAAAGALAAGADLAGDGLEARLRAAVVRAGVLAKSLAGERAAGLASGDVLWQLLHEGPTSAAAATAAAQGDAERFGAMRDLATTAF